MTIIKLSNCRHRLRTQTGSLTTILCAAVLLAIVGIGAFAMDIGHNITVRSELQSGSDAAALAGAEDLLLQKTWANADNDALTVAGQNTADGKEIANASPGAAVTVQSEDPNGATPGSCQVNSDMKINNLFAKLFGHNTDNVDVTATADCWTQVNSIYAGQMFPISPSLTDTSHGPAIGTLHIGDPITIAIEPSGGNAAWTSGTPAMTHPSTPVIQAALDVAVGLAKPNGTNNPSMTADGVQQIALTEGLHNGVDLTQAPYPQLMEQMNYIVLPVINGSKPYVQSRVLQGFIAVKVNTVSTGAGTLILTGTLVKGQVKGTGGLLPDAGSSTLNQALSQLSVGTVKLVQ